MAEQKVRTLPETPDLAEAVAWLECEGRASSVLYGEVERLIQHSPARKGSLFLILRHLDRIEGSLTGFVLVLERILRTSPVRVTLGDPSGYVALVMACLDREPQVPLFRIDPGHGPSQPLLIVDSSRPSAELLGQVLGAFGRPCVLAQNGVDARHALRSSRYGLVLLDLDLPRMQSFGIAELAKERSASTAIVGMTSREEPWARENAVRYGFAGILPKPTSILDVLGLIR